MTNQTKKCRKCKRELELDHFLKANIGQYGVSSTCRSCMYKKKAEPQQRGHLFSAETKREILYRDRTCINPHCQKLEPFSLHCHHVLFHPLEKIHDFEEANRSNKGVALCTHCHTSLHNGNKLLDVYCHLYLEKYKNY